MKNSVSSEFRSTTWNGFWFTPGSPTALHILRVATGLLLLAWLVPLTSARDAFFGIEGFFDRESYLALAEFPPEVRPSWSILFLTNGDPVLLEIFWWGTLAIIGLFTLGVAPRITGVLTWVCAGSCLVNPAMTYDPDYLIVTLAFYCMLGYLLMGQWSGEPTMLQRIVGDGRWMLFSRWFGKNRAPETPSYAANFVIRLVQVHFAIVVFVGAAHKLQFGDWWAGAAYWYPLHPAFSTTMDSLRFERSSATAVLFGLSILQYVALAWQFTFPWFTFRPGWRVVLLGGAVVGWLGTVFVHGMPLFGPLYLTICLSYVQPEEWSAWWSRWRATAEREPGLSPRQAAKAKYVAQNV